MYGRHHSKLFSSPLTGRHILPAVPGLWVRRRWEPVAWSLGAPLPWRRVPKPPLWLLAAFRQPLATRGPPASPRTSCPCLWVFSSRWLQPLLCPFASAWLAKRPPHLSDTSFSSFLVPFSSCCQSSSSNGTVPHCPLNLKFPWLPLTPVGSLTA